MISRKSIDEVLACLPCCNCSSMYVPGLASIWKLKLFAFAVFNICGCNHAIINYLVKVWVAPFSAGTERKHMLVLWFALWNWLARMFIFKRLKKSCWFLEVLAFSSRPKPPTIASKHYIEHQLINIILLMILINWCLI